MNTEQEAFWSGEFGDEYTDRNVGTDIVSNNVHFFRDSLIIWPWELGSVIEFGANRGLNIEALIRVGTRPEYITAVEINHKACDELRKIDGITVLEQSMFDYIGSKQFGMVISKGLLIHIGPDKIEKAMDVLYQSCGRGGHVLVAEYFAPSEVEVIYRGYANKLWRRPYGDMMLARFPDLKLLDYGFVGKCDPVAPQDDINWWLMERK
jgi:pseudaminic acid biosynthesis-associated methylase